MKDWQVMSSLSLLVAIAKIVVDKETIDRLCDVRQVTSSP